ncbi:nuclear transport factor 2 family protein [Aquimarina sp. 2201CG5-10]|uniref:nuclear transport factor 2 family protein n=1 Tax=Aquimarina callyspongiae TaxID=3098150 RepID=UPI002AB3407D|nr:nuclear transport factor 2 family protein [Aquimarina sp. 2201CG5-10]MDY8137149.1 nuclear transport factor 2 family protein [Aquimarina sp. 2201CG5-10]
MKTCLWIVLFLTTINVITAQSEEEKIRITIQKYLKGTSYSNPEMIKEAFYEEADLFLSHKEKEIWVVSPEEYANLFVKREKGVFNGRTGNIISMDIEGNIATAKAEILIESKKVKYIDIFLLKKIKGQWKVISKAATIRN